MNIIEKIPRHVENMLLPYYTLVSKQSVSNLSVSTSSEIRYTISPWMVIG
uniref:Uncharacterized protein n=1 Tax=Arion vulgaris TaxID=1028688 RepID=A0A0B6ZR46_9EUPU